MQNAWNIKSSCALLLICGIVLHLLAAEAAAAKDARTIFYEADACYGKLKKNPALQKYRSNWLKCAERFVDVYRYDSSGPWAAAGLYMAGKMYAELYGKSYRQSDKDEAIDFFTRVLKRFPNSRYRPKAAADLRTLGKPAEAARASESNTQAKFHSLKYATRKRVSENKVQTPKPAQPVKTYTPAVSAPSGDKKAHAVVTGVRHWSNPNYTRIVIDTDRDVTYTHSLLKKDTVQKRPQRLYVDLAQALLGKDIKTVIPIDDNLLTDVRAGQFAADSVRVVVDLKSFKTHKIFSLKNPSRIVIDIRGHSAKSDQKPTTTVNLPPGKVGVGDIATQLALGVRRIVIDPGHGGQDYGAPGYYKGVHEKRVVLEIGQRLARKIRAQLGCEAILTRANDKSLTLEERTAFANIKKADLFISIHTNAARDRRAYGIETYFLNLATDQDAILVAARENATSTKNISDLETILSDLMNHAKINESSRLANHVQKAMVNQMKVKYQRIKSKGVKQAPFYVLLGAEMPSILIETSFISNSRECKRLTDTTYQDALCDAIIKGIKSYIKETAPAARHGKSGKRPS